MLNLKSISPMRILMIYGQEGIVVPCGDGRRTIHDLAKIAAKKYKNVIKENEISIHRLTLIPSDCMLDWGDRICDVLDNLDKVKVWFDPSNAESNQEVPNCSDSNQNVYSALPQLIGQESDSQIASTALDRSSASVSEFGAPAESTSVEVESDWNRYLETVNLASIKRECTSNNFDDSEITLVVESDVPPTVENVEKTQRKYNCDICGKMFVNVTSVSRHKKSHHNEQKRYQCEICNKFLCTPSSLRSHKFTHTGLKPFKCDVCSLSFTKPYSVRRHKQIHNKGKNH